MMTLRLWRIFYNSLPRHPLFWQSLNSNPEASATSGKGWQWRVWQAGSALFGLVIFMGLLAFGIPILFLSYLFVFIGGLVGGGNAAVGVSGAIAEEQEKGRYDLLALSPPGMFGTGWALATRFLRTNRNALRLAKLIRAFHLICFLGVIFMVAVNAIFAVSLGMVSSLLELGIVEMVVVLLLIIALHLDFIQARLLGAMIGILAPTLNQRRVESGMTAIGIFLIAQMTIYLVIYSSINLLIALGVESALLLAFLTLVFVFLLHEIALYSIWRMMRERLNLEPDLLETLKR
jgi:hypothetical protein